jgi:hypothetical protein
MENRVQKDQSARVLFPSAAVGLRICRSILVDLGKDAAGSEMQQPPVRPGILNEIGVRPARQPECLGHSRQPSQQGQPWPYAHVISRSS